MAKVYFTKEISEDSLVKMFEVLGVELSGKVCVKLHSGEEGNQNYLRPEMVKKLVERVNGTVVECNTAYEGSRDTTEKHTKLMEKHGWTKYFNVDIMDGEGNDKILSIPNGNVIKKNYVGSHIDNYDSMLVLSHFKGHPMGGYGGSLKQLSIGLASGYGKRYIHCVGKENGTYELGVVYCFGISIVVFFVVERHVITGMPFFSRLLIDNHRQPLLPLPHLIACIKKHRRYTGGCGFR